VVLPIAANNIRPGLVSISSVRELAARASQQKPIRISLDTTFPDAITRQNFEAAIKISGFAKFVHDEDGWTVIITNPNSAPQVENFLRIYEKNLQQIIWEKPGAAYRDATTGWIMPKFNPLFNAQRNPLKKPKTGPKRKPKRT
jgi:hypothetical protein